MKTLFLTAALSQAVFAGNLLISSRWLEAHLHDPNVVALHVGRERAGYDTGHIPGACYIPWEKLTTTREGIPVELPPAAELQRLFEGCGVSDGSRIVLYSDRFNLDAARAYVTLDYLGQAGRAVLLDGGLEQWRAEKRLLETTPPAARGGKLTVRLRPQVVVGLDQMRDLAWAASQGNTGVLILDSRPADGFRAGHLPGAVNAFWMDDLVSKEQPVFRAAGELRRRYGRLGAAPGKTIVVYCQVGVQASKTYFTLKHLGYDVRLYDGSFAQWSRAKDAPVAH
jgi:thiosulfate/3-mercaptopyruvate sulfurtransferase